MLHSRDVHNWASGWYADWARVESFYPETGEENKRSDWVVDRPAWDETVTDQEAWDEAVVDQEAWDEVIVDQEAWDETVVDTPAWDEDIIIHYQCSCGETKAP